jgi:outer membrane protein assembly factor BamB
VSLLDGNVVALDEATGETLWAFDTGSPLVSASGTTDGEGGSGADGPSTIFPGADGSLYAYRHNGILARGVEVGTPGFTETNGAQFVLLEWDTRPSLWQPCIGCLFQ